MLIDKFNQKQDLFNIITIDLESLDLLMKSMIINHNSATFGYPHGAHA